MGGILNRVASLACVLFGVCVLLCAATVPAAAGGIGLNAGDCPPVGSQHCGHPINISTGFLFEEVTDYESAGPNKLSFTRYYNTEARGGLLGNWSSTYTRFLDVSSASLKYADRPDGKEIMFFPDGSGGWRGPSDLDIKLRQSGSNWILTDWEENVETYTPVPASSGVRLTSLRARNGYTQTWQYNSNGQLASVRDSYGRTLSFSYSSSSAFDISLVTTPDGLVIHYTYGGSGQPSFALTGVGFSTSPATSQRLIYNTTPAGERLAKIIDENGHELNSWTYETGGNYRATSSRRANGVELTQISGDDNRTRTVTNALGQQEVYHYDFVKVSPEGVFFPICVQIDRLATSTTAAATRRFTYDARGYLASETDWKGVLTTYVNNARGLPTKITEASGTPQQRIKTITYHATFRLALKVVEPGLTTNFTYDAQGNLLTRSETDTTSSSGQTRTWTFTWSNALLASVKDPRGKVTSYAHDGSGALVTVTNALGQQTRITQHTASGLPLTIVDANGVTTHLTYDGRMRLTSQTVDTSAGQRRTSYTYDAVGNLRVHALPGGAQVSYSYDAANRLVRTTDLFGQRIDHALNALGKPTLTEISSGGTVSRRHSAAYDALGRLRTNLGGAGQRTDFSYDGNGNAVSILAPLGRTTAQVFDALDRVTRITDPASGVAAVAYDAQDRPVSVTDPKGNATGNTYNGFGEVVQTLSPDTGKTIYQYDLAGNLTAQTDARGFVVTHAYDALNRRTASAFFNATAENIAYRYDEAGSGFGKGRLTSVTDAAGTLRLVYDERGNVIRETRVISGQTLLTQYSYDAAGRLSAILYPSGYVVLYGRDAMGRTISASLRAPGATSTRSIVNSATYRPFGPVNGFVYGNGVAETRGFDLDYRLARLVVAGQSSLLNLTYAYNAADNLVSVADANGATRDQSFTYDALDRLTRAAGSYGNIGYAYDANGNRLSQTQGAATFSYLYAAGSNRLASVRQGSATVRSFIHLANGAINRDTTSAGISNLSYNRAGRLAGVTRAGSPTAVYKYDAFGRRRSTVLTSSTSSLTTLFQHDPAGRLIEEAQLRTNAAPLRVDTIYFDDRPVARLDANTGKLSFIHTDRLGTPQLATDSTQAVVWRAVFQPFGSGAPTGAINLPLRLPGQFADSSGYFQNGFRDYDPTLGRYLQSDPIGLSGGLNTYAYAGSNPLKWIDPSGLQTSTNFTVPPGGQSFATPGGFIVSTDSSTGFSVITGPGGQIILLQPGESVRLPHNIVVRNDTFRPPPPPPPIPLEYDPVPVVCETDNGKPAWTPGVINAIPKGAENSPLFSDAPMEPIYVPEYHPINY